MKKSDLSDVVRKELSLTSEDIGVVDRMTDWENVVRRVQSGFKEWVESKKGLVIFSGGSYSEFYESGGSYPYESPGVREFRVPADIYHVAGCTMVVKEYGFGHSGAHQRQEFGIVLHGTPEMVCALANDVQAYMDELKRKSVASVRQV